MNPFNLNAACPKCGHDVVRTHYCSGKGTYYGSPCYGLTDASEHLHRNCDRCCYAWLERCLSGIAVDERGQLAAANGKDTGGGG